MPYSWERKQFLRNSYRCNWLTSQYTHTVQPHYLKLGYLELSAASPRAQLVFPWIHFAVTYPRLSRSLVISSLSSFPWGFEIAGFDCQAAGVLTTPENFISTVMQPIVHANIINPSRKRNFSKMLEGHWKRRHSFSWGRKSFWRWGFS